MTSHIMLLFSAMFTCFTISSTLAGRCDGVDRKYSCDCKIDLRNISMIEDETDDSTYDLSTDNFYNFEPTIKYLRYCQGNFQCTPNFKSSRQFATTKENYVMCFSEDSCLSNGTLHRPAGSCVLSACMHLSALQDFLVTNDAFEEGSYKCVKLDESGLLNPICIAPLCKNFVALERYCACNFDSQECICSPVCPSTFTSPQYNTYALFLSFGEVFHVAKGKSPLIHSAILIVLCVGLSILLIIFCRLCKVTMDRSNCGNEANNTENLRRFVASNLNSNRSSASTATKNSTSPVVAERSSPPPTYEQVLKDKCIEFKNSIK